MTTDRMKIGVQLPEVEWEVPFPELIAMAADRRERRVRFASGSAIICCTNWTSTTGGRGRSGRRSQRSRHRPRRSSSGHWWRRPASTLRRCLPNRRRPSTRSRAGRLILGLGRRMESSRVRRVRVRLRPSSQSVRGGLHDHPNAAARRLDRLPRGVLRRGPLRPAPAIERVRAAADGRARSVIGCSTSRSPMSIRGTCGGASTATRVEGFRREKERVDDVDRDARSNRRPSRRPQRCSSNSMVALAV